MAAFIGSRSLIKILENLGLLHVHNRIIAKMKACFLQLSQVIHFTNDTLKFTAKETVKFKNIRGYTHILLVEMDVTGFLGKQSDISH